MCVCKFRFESRSNYYSKCRNGFWGRVDSNGKSSCAGGMLIKKIVFSFDFSCIVNMNEAGGVCRGWTRFDDLTVKVHRVCLKAGILDVRTSSCVKELRQELKRCEWGFRFDWRAGSINKSWLVESCRIQLLWWVHGCCWMWSCWVEWGNQSANKLETSRRVFCCSSARVPSFLQRNDFSLEFSPLSVESSGIQSLDRVHCEWLYGTS